MPDDNKTVLVHWWVLDFWIENGTEKSVVSEWFTCLSKFLNLDWAITQWELIGEAPILYLIDDVNMW